jgi:hypothetical protein
LSCISRSVSFSDKQQIPRAKNMALGMTKTFGLAGKLVEENACAELV